MAQMLHGAGIFTNIYPNNHPNVGKYTIHGAYGWEFNHETSGTDSDRFAKSMFFMMKNIFENLNL
jgi:hypothetical protein